VLNRVWKIKSIMNLCNLINWPLVQQVHPISWNGSKGVWISGRIV